jgi:hypothetical protein
MRKPCCHQFFDRFVARLAGADQPDDFVDVADGENQAFENMLALLRLFRAGTSSAG